MYGPFVPDMYSRNFVHYDKFAGSDPVLERPITTTGYTDLVMNPTGGYELIPPTTPTARLQRGSTVYKERFYQNSNGGLRFLLISIFASLAMFFLMRLLSKHMMNTSDQGNLLIFIMFSLLAIIVSSL